MQTFIDSKLWDEALVFKGEVYFKQGVKAPNFHVKINTELNIKGDKLKTYYND